MLARLRRRHGLAALAKSLNESRSDLCLFPRRPRKFPPSHSTHATRVPAAGRVWPRASSPFPRGSSAASMPLPFGATASVLPTLSHRMPRYRSSTNAPTYTHLGCFAGGHVWSLAKTTPPAGQCPPPAHRRGPVIGHANAAACSTRRCNPPRRLRPAPAMHAAARSAAAATRQSPRANPSHAPRRPTDPHTR